MFLICVLILWDHAEKVQSFLKDMATRFTEIG